MNYTCWGAARQVTGSMHLLEFRDGFRVLLDCGIDYEDNNDQTINSTFPFDPESIDVLVLTHAHIDHSGNIPNLVRQGFQGEIICTEPTAYLLDKLWTDTLNIRNRDKGKNRSAKLFGFADIKHSLDQILTLPFYKEFALNDAVKLRFYEAGHILGAASVSIEYQEEGKTKRVGFTGDLGNFDTKLVVDPKPMPDLNFLITESTYGNRNHKVKLGPIEELKNQVVAACVKKPGRLIIPAFSVGRTQAILLTLKQLFESGEIPPIKVFADSPLAFASTNIHNKFHEFLNADARSEKENTGVLFEFKNLTLIEDEDDVEEFEFYRDACIIVSSAGMLEGGRIQQHISDHVMNPLCTILIAGFCAPGTLGARLLEGATVIRIKGKERYVYANILQTDVFSAHPDRDGLLRYIDEVQNTGKLEQLFLVHGEESSMDGFRNELEEIYDLPILMPTRGQAFSL